MQKINTLCKKSCQITGVCMEIHRILRKGLLKIVYKDAISKCLLGLIVNFGEDSLKTKRGIL